MGEPRLLFGGRPDVESEVLGRPIERWMWGGLPTQVALDQWAQVSAPWMDGWMDGWVNVLHPARKAKAWRAKHRMRQRQVA